MPIFTTQTVKIQHSFKNNFKINSKVGARANRKGSTRFRFPYKAYYSFPRALVDRFIIIFLDFSLFNPSCVPVSTSQYFFDIDFPLPEPVLKTGFQIQIVQKWKCIYSYIHVPMRLDRCCSMNNPPRHPRSCWAGRRSRTAPASDRHPPGGWIVRAPMSPSWPGSDASVPIRRLPQPHPVRPTSRRNHFWPASWRHESLAKNKEINRGLRSTYILHFKYEIWPKGLRGNKMEFYKNNLIKH